MHKLQEPLIQKQEELEGKGETEEVDGEEGLNQTRLNSCSSTFWGEKWGN